MALLYTMVTFVKRKYLTAQSIVVSFNFMSDFGAQATALDMIRGFDLTGSIALVTGASSGIGRATAEALAQSGAKVWLGVRDLQAGMRVADVINASTAGYARPVRLDLADIDSVRKCAAEIVADDIRLDILIANAGVSKTPEAHLPNGLDVRFATNHLGHFLLVHLLKDRLASARGRVVLLSSAAHKGRHVRLDDLQWQSRPHQDLAAYGESKAANILFCIEAARRWATTGITFNAVLPGTALTGLQRYHGDDLKRQIGFIRPDGSLNPIMKSVEQAAATSIWAATAAELNGRSGLVLEDCAVALEAGPETHPWCGFDATVANPDTAIDLWDQSLKLLEHLGFDPSS